MFDDARLFLHATQGPDEADILSAPRPLDLAEPVAGSARGLRVALSIDLGEWAVETSVEAAVRGAAEALVDAGAEIVEVNPKIGRHEERAWHRLWEVFMATYYGHLVDEFGDRMSPEVLRLIDKGMSISAVDYKRIEYDRSAMWRRVAPILEQNDVLLSPTMSTGPVAAAVADIDLSGAPDDGRFHSPDMTAVWNMISPCPALTVPCGLDADGLPVGAHLVGRRWQEDSLLGIGAALEAVLPAIGRPPI